MNIDFYKQFKDYSNVELLKVIRRPDDYMVAAIESATQILSTRNVSQSEIEEADTYCQKIDNEEKTKTEKINSYKTKITDFFNPILNPQDAEFKSDKWLIYFYVLIGSSFLWKIYRLIKELIAYFQYYNYSLFGAYLIIADLIFYSAICYLLYKRNKWGWVLLFAVNLSIFLGYAAECYMFFKYQEIHRGKTSDYLITVLVPLVFVLFLWRKSVSDFLGVTEKMKRRTATIVTIAVILFLGIVYLVSN